MSIATAHWNGNARDDINEGVARINAPQVGDFRLSRDFLLKAALLLAKTEAPCKYSNLTLMQCRRVPMKQEKNRKPSVSSFIGTERLVLQTALASADSKIHEAISSKVIAIRQYEYL
ncbi:MAG: hypothetical protein OXF06_02135 [Bacteroidetes bacterium]|nr:hypothetical protein [Bacteroidota bacterium]